MPTVPRLTNTQVAPAPLPMVQRRAQPSALGAAGDAFERLAHIGSQIYAYDREQKHQSLMATSQQELEQYGLDLENDHDYDTQVERFRAKAGEIQQRVQKGTKDPYLVRRFNAEFGELARKQDIDVQRKALKGKIGEQRAGATETLRVYGTLAGKSPEDDAEILRKGDDVLQGAYQAGVMDLETAQAERAKFRSAVTVAGVRREILADPTRAERALLAGDFPELSGNDRQIWLERASAASDSLRRQALAEEDRAFRLQERAQKDREESFSKEGDQLAARGQLTPEWIERNRNNLSPSDLRYFYRRVSGDEVTTNLNVYTDLRERAARGEDVRDAARNALTGGQIKPSDYDRIIGVAEREGGDGWFRRGSQFIERSLKPSDVNPDPAAPQRYAQAMDDWYDWAKKNPQATEEQAKAAHERIVSEFALLNWNEMLLTKRQPTFLVGTRGQPDLDATEAATVQAFEAGQIDREEFDRQAHLLQQWRDAYTKAHPAQPAPKAGK